jgi:hypothetical protein
MNSPQQQCKENGRSDKKTKGKRLLSSNGGAATIHDEARFCRVEIRAHPPSCVLLPRAPAREKKSKRRETSRRSEDSAGTLRFYIHQGYLGISFLLYPIQDSLFRATKAYIGNPGLQASIGPPTL